MRCAVGRNAQPGPFREPPHDRGHVLEAVPFHLLADRCHLGLDGLGGAQDLGHGADALGHGGVVAGEQPQQSPRVTLLAEGLYLRPVEDARLSAGGEPDVHQGGEQPGLAAECGIDGVGRYLGRVRDLPDRRRSVPLPGEQIPGGVQDRCWVRAACSRRTGEW